MLEHRLNFLGRSLGNGLPSDPSRLASRSRLLHRPCYDLFGPRGSEGLMRKNKIVIRTDLFILRYVHCCKPGCRHCPHGPYIYSPHGRYFGHPDFETFSHAVKFALTRRRHRGKKIDKTRLQRVCSVAEKVAQSIAAGAAAGAAAHGIDLL